ncbi:MAG: RdgB/HAM1 family non-canonical purine NTP pyrophosphatase [Acutalibacteraceae bacterium]|nr:RdgB/HAM1 family non-canonical purine NTP pyrophosphatase [Acutalibacteraceae bacterium]
MTFLIATKNKGKKKELERILLPLGISVISEADLDKPLCEVEENGLTFEENALIKARAACKATGYPTVADDSGLCVDFLDGAPGVYTARYAGEPSNSDKNNAKLLWVMRNVPMEKRTARFVSAVACVFPEGREFTVRGECEGKIGTELKGNGGFGYDPLFISELGCFGEISDEEKDSISHRGKALKELSKKLKEEYLC